MKMILRRVDREDEKNCFIFCKNCVDIKIRFHWMIFDCASMFDQSEIRVKKKMFCSCEQHTPHWTQRQWSKKCHTGITLKEWFLWILLVTHPNLEKEIVISNLNDLYEMIMILSVDVRIFIVSMDSSASASLMFHGLHRYLSCFRRKNRIIELRLFEWE